MKKQLTRLKKHLITQKIPSVIMVLTAATLIITLSSNKDGAAKNGERVTGAPFDNRQTCANCHGGGNFGATAFAKLYKSDSTLASTYVPNQNYYLVVIFRNTSGNPKNGFQTTCATTPGNVNYNGWRSLPAGTANRVLAGRNYVEHTAPLTIDTVIIPWKAPAAGTGSVTFYTAQNFVNGNNSENGDQVVKTNFTVAEGAAEPPVAAVDKFANRVQPAPQHALTVYKHAGVLNMQFTNAGPRQTGMAVVSDMQGRQLYSSKVLLNEGPNVFAASVGSYKGLAVATVITADGIKTSQKLVLE